MARGKGEGSITWDATNGVWVGRIALPAVWDDEKGKWKRRSRSVSSKTKKIAMQKLRDIQREAAQGVLSSRSTTVEAWVTHWLGTIAPKKYAPKTMSSYRSALEKHVVRRWGAQRLDYLTPTRIRELTQEIAVTSSPGMARNLHIPLSSCLKDAVNDGFLSTHPMEHLTAPKRGKKEENALSVDQAVTLLKWLARQMDLGTKHAPMAPLWIAYLLTGARRGELLGLRPEYVGESLRVEWQLQRIQPADLEKVGADYEYEYQGVSNFYLVRPKYESARSYPLVEPLRTVMLSLAEQTPEGALIFQTSDGRPWDPDTITRRWSKMLAAAGIEKHDGPASEQTPRGERIKLHGVRHTVVDLLYMLEVPEHIIGDIVGHTTRKVTRGYRTKQSPAVKTAMESIAHLVSTGEKPHQLVS